MKYLLSSLLLMSSCVDYNYNYPNKEDVYPAHKDNYEIEYLEQVDTFYGESAKPVDILFVIDRSCSMLDDMDYLSLNSYNFFRELRNYNINYRVGVTTTNGPSNGILSTAFEGIRYISPKYENPEGIFMSMMGSNTLGGAGEEGFTAIRYTFSTNKDVDFFRYNVPLRIIIISDENDNSLITTKELINFLEKKVEPRKNYDLIISGVLFGGPNSECLAGVEVLGTKYVDLINHFNGTKIDICEMNWAGVLSDLITFSLDYSDHEYYLSNNPIEDSIEIHVIRNGATIVLENNMFNYSESENKITINEFEIEDEDVVKIIYTRDM